MDVFIGQLMLVPYNFAPRGWAFCQGQLMSIPQNTALFSLLGTTYGGDGRSTFALPNLQGSLAISSGNGTDGNTYVLGQVSGVAAVTLTTGTMPAHTHAHQASNVSHNSPTPVGNNFGSAPPRTPTGSYASPPNSGNQVNMNQNSVMSAGNGLPHSNIMPTIALNYIIALTGIFPSRP